MDWKRKLLLFDKIVLVHTSFSNSFWQTVGDSEWSDANKAESGKEKLDLGDFIRDREFLEENGYLISDINAPKELENIFLDASKQILSEEVVERLWRGSTKRLARDLGKGVGRLSHSLSHLLATEAAVGELKARQIAGQLRHELGMEAHSIEPSVRYKGSSRILQLLGENKSKIEMNFVDVIQVVMGNIVMPSDNVPWQAIFEFRSDAEAMGYLCGLRNLIRRLSRGGHTKNELEEEFQYNLFKHNQKIKYHKMDGVVSCIGFSFACGASFAEDLLKIRWRNLAESALDVARYKQRRMKFELSAEHPELTYIIRAQEALSR